MFGLFGNTHRAGHTINQEYDEGDMVTALGPRKMSTNRANLDLGDAEQSPPLRKMQTRRGGETGCKENRQDASGLKSSSESPDSDLENKLQSLKLKSFLERHGFEGPENPRESNYSRIRMKPVYPIDVAEELGDKEMLEILGAHLSKRRSGSHNHCLEQTSNRRSGYDVGDEAPIISVILWLVIASFLEIRLKFIVSQKLPISDIDFFRSLDVTSFCPDGFRGKVLCGAATWFAHVSSLQVGRKWNLT